MSVQHLAAAIAATLPSLLAYNPPPSPTFLNQAVALALWGLFLAVAAGPWRAAGRHGRCLRHWVVWRWGSGWPGAPVACPPAQRCRRWGCWARQR
jgi:hypothetical protein